MIPDEFTVAGQVLEAEAVAAERLHGDPSTVDSPPPPLIHRPIGPVTHHEAIQRAPIDPVPAPDRHVEPAPLTTSPVTADQTGRVLAEWQNPAVTGSGLPSLPSASPLNTTPSPADPQSEESAAQQQLLDVINTERVARGEAPQEQLSDAELEQLRQMLAVNAVVARPNITTLPIRGLVDGPLHAWPVPEPDRPTEDTGAMSPPVPLTSIVFPTAVGTAPEITTVPSSAPSPDTTYAAGERVPSINTTTQPDDALIHPSNVDVDLDHVDMEELSTRLYDRLRTRLRLELLVDRERAGLLSDFR